MKGILRTILDNYRDVAMYQRGIQDIMAILDGHDISPSTYEDVNLSVVVHSIKRLKKKN